LKKGARTNQQTEQGGSKSRSRGNLIEKARSAKLTGGRKEWGEKKKTAKQQKGGAGEGKLVRKEAVHFTRRQGESRKTGGEREGVQKVVQKRLSPYLTKNRLKYKWKKNW